MQNGSFKIKNSIKHKVMCGLVNNINKIVFKYLFWMLYDDQKWKILNASYMYVLKYSKKYHMDYNKISSGLRIRTNRDVEYYNLIQTWIIANFKKMPITVLILIILFSVENSISWFFTLVG
jgi:hypothetical protein